MAELVGLLESGITIVGCVKLCVDAFDVFFGKRDSCDLELQRLLLKMAGQRVRLYTWAIKVGVIDETGNDTSASLNNYPFKTLICETLDSIRILFADSDAVASRYGCRRKDAKSKKWMDRDQTALRLSRAFSYFQFQLSPRRRHQELPIYAKTKWLIHDRRKFKLMISHLKDLIDDLQAVTASISTPAQQLAYACDQMTKVRDTRALELLERVCHQDYPDLADAASDVFDVRSEPDFKSSTRAVRKAKMLALHKPLPTNGFCQPITGISAPWKPVYYFFYGATRNPHSLAKRLKLPTLPVMEQARVPNASVGQFGTSKIFMDGPPGHFAHGKVYRVENEKHDRHFHRKPGQNWTIATRKAHVIREGVEVPVDVKVIKLRISATSNEADEI